VHHEGVDETLHDGALRLAETLGGIPPQKNSRTSENGGKKEKNSISKRKKISVAFYFC
jgi:hypothetical protein